ncbi:aminotransferase class I/II-fold pyridoxal phosphate-dependent enzyme [Clostridium bovifaecis]|uniref:Aminotransferase class I/II-fold pyridoxal phosphate-dependent enzyme n=1 Tax=Clostridium bovifaecis TaxID=2184719 RepID=A0A6I6EU94_9CLOT|nr:aminotransferase class I/II-fold pyridoxal phosphate-dependent enzyme [Clostridium bovifaecis]
MEHGGDIYTEGILKGREIIDFSSNINPLGVPESFKAHIGEALEAAERYPDIKYRKLKEYIVDYLKFSGDYFRSDLKSSWELSIDEGNIALGNGAAEIIDLVISCFKSICIVVPSFIEYEKSALKWQVSVGYSKLTEDMNYNYEDIFSKMQNVEALIIGNPNNPNGGVIDKEKFKIILNYCEENNKKVIIDEAFIEFTGKRGFSFIEFLNYKCVFIIRALTKFYAMPGIRMGYGLCKDENLINNIRKMQNPWNINCFAETAAKYVLKDFQYIERSLEWVEEERDFMFSNLKSIDAIEKVYTTYSNFILCKLKDLDCHRLYGLSMKSGIAIRKCHNFKGLNEYYVRFAIKDRKNNRKLIEFLKSVK